MCEKEKKKGRGREWVKGETEGRQKSNEHQVNEMNEGASGGKVGRRRKNFAAYELRVSKGMCVEVIEVNALKREVSRERCGTRWGN